MSMGQGAEARWISPGETSNLKDKASFSSNSTSHKLRDRVGTFRAEKHTELLHCDFHHVPKIESTRLVHSCPPKISRPRIPIGALQRESRGVEELVKYMSEVPAYLQLLDKGDTNQEKALNMGVINWGHLQKWTDRRRPLKMQCQKSSSCCSLSSSCNGGVSSDIYGVKRLPYVQPRFHSSVDKNSDKQETQKKSPKPLANFDSSSMVLEDASDRCLLSHTMLPTKEDAHGILAEMFASSTSDGSTCSSQEVNTSFSTASECEIPTSSEINKGCPSRFRTNHVQVNSMNQFNGYVSDKFEIQKCSKWNEQCPETPPVYSQGIPNARLSLDSAISENKILTSEEGYLSRILSEDASFPTPFSDVPYSCPLPSRNEGWGWSDTNSVAPGETGVTLPETADLLDQVTVQKTSRFSCNLEQTDDFTSQTPKLVATGGKADIMPEDVVEAAIAKARETLHGLGWVSRSSSHNEIEARKPGKMTAHLNEMGLGDTTTVGRARRSPLRRMLDPLVKPRVSVRCPESVASSPASFVHRFSFSDKPHPRGETEVKDCRDPLPEGRTSSPAGKEVGRLTFSSWVCESQSGSLDDKHGRSKMQALLRLASKNDLPVFTFSINDDDILVSTRKNTVSDKQNVECLYTFYYVREIKKKSVVWRNQGSKTKRQQLVSKAVGRMSVTCADFSEASASVSADHSPLRREFVLFGKEIRPAASETSQLLPESELAAIVIKCQKDSSADCGNSPSFKIHYSASEHENISSSSSIVAILPSEVHGLSEAGAPSPLIQRWKSGGSCDCGGWDVGCSLSILTENMPQDARAAVVTPRIELVMQGGSNNSPVFCLVPFNEGLYAVDFDESISVLQAFSLCIALLHTRKPYGLSRLHHPLQQQILARNILLKNPRDGKAPAECGPYHPPHSPVGRA